MLISGTVDRGTTTQQCYVCHLFLREFTTKIGILNHVNYCKHKIMSVRKGNGEDIEKQHEITNSMPADDPKANSGSGVNVQQLTIKIWGNHSKDDLHQVVNAVYKEIVFYCKNLFELRSGNIGNRFILEITRVIDAWTGESEHLKDIAIKVLMIMPSILLQTWWEQGDFDKLMHKSRAIQRRIKQFKN